MVQEFGTFNVFRMLKALREENRWHHYGQKEQINAAIQPSSNCYRHSAPTTIVGGERF